MSTNKHQRDRDDYLREMDQMNLDRLLALERRFDNRMQVIADRLAFQKAYVIETRRLVDELEWLQDNDDTHDIAINGTEYKGSCDDDCWCKDPDHIIEERYFDKNIIQDRRNDALRKGGGEY
jgi:hypothetical protein